ncbi:MAG TPA: carbamoyltransferase C-terminal domain-containing protein [Candidatus Eisenbacteria bacterium]|nr:carbamoyltransferase C-terminal domain-containing protein [Candidatus Eisenbacteria bacterium]
MTNILGINAYHGDSSACLVRDGKLIAAAEEERFRRIKHWAGLPTQAIAYCLAEGHIKLRDVDHVTINRNPKVNHLRRFAFVISHRPQTALILSKLRNIRKAATIESALQNAFPNETLNAKVHHIEHHLAHLASAHFVSPFPESVAVSVDGFGDFASAAWGLARGGQIQIDGRVYFPHSLGIFYSALTQWLGFPFYGDEYKVMGLAPYGEPEFLDQMQQIVRLQADGTFNLNLRFFRHHVENVSYSWQDCAPEVGVLYTPALDEFLGPARKKGEELTQTHKDIARSVQAMYEEAVFHLLNAIHKKYRCDCLTLSGGCAMNSVANGKVYQQTPFKRVYIPAAAGDAGGAIGGAFAVWELLKPSGARFHMDHAYWGPEFDDAEITRLLKDHNSELKIEHCKIEKFSDPLVLCSQTAQAISEGKVVGWFQGRMEWGPRALGNRSIVCDPRRADMKDILNRKIKRRESFRPFAPSILRETVRDWFETDDDVPFMMQVFQVRAEKRARLPAITHVDGSGRLQTVHRATNPLYYQLIEQFQRLTGVPMVLNTSFNENEPVVCRPQEALDCFLRTRMDVLVLGNFFVERLENDQSRMANDRKNHQ